jgi:hypothetical protein
MPCACKEEFGQQAAVLGPGQQGGGGGRAGEGERVQAPGDGGVEEPVDGPDVLRRHPPVDGNPHDLGSGCPQRLHEPGQRLAVQLYGDTAALDALLQEPVEHLGHGLGGGRPLLGQSLGPYGALHLGAAREQFDPAQPTEQGLAEPPPVGGLDPAAEADRGGGDHDVGRLVDQLLGGGEEFAVVGERHDAQGGRVLDDGAASLEQSPEFVGPTRGRHTHGEPREGAAVLPDRSLLFVVHGSRLALGASCGYG